MVLVGADRDEVFAKVCEKLPIFAEYQQRTTRVIPVVELVRNG